MSLGDPIDEAVSALSDRTALIVDGSAFTYRDVGDAVSAAVANLNACGVARGHRVALADRCGLFALAGVLGAARIGAAAAPMSPALTSGEIAALAAAAGCGEVGLAGAEARAQMSAALGREPLGEADLLSRGEPSEAPAAAGHGDEVALVLFTGGTTGIPKPIPITHAIIEARVRSFAPRPDPATRPVMTLVCVPFHHVAGLVGLLVGLAGGSTIVVQPRFDAGEWIRLVARHRIARTFLVPAMLHRILEHPSFADADLSSLAMITYGAAPAPAGLVERAVAALSHVGFVNVFGQTETLGAVTALGPDEHRAGRAGSVGKALPGVEIRIVDPATGEDGDAGEMWVRAAHTVEHGWLRTGDLVRREPDGYLSATGRLSDVINRGGEKIAPFEIDQAIRAHAAVADVAVVGVADPELGERVAAAIVGHSPVDADEIRAWCSTRLAAYKVPDRIRFVDALPRTELGKVSPPAVRALFDEA